MSKFKYLIKDRLTEVVTLIQFFGFSNYEYLSSEDLFKVFGQPVSSKNWPDLIKAHSELFTIVQEKIYLNIRFYKSPKLDVNEVFNLIGFANGIHDKELAQRNKNNHRIPIYVSLIATLVSLLSLFYNSYKTTDIIKLTIREELKHIENSKENGSSELPFSKKTDSLNLKTRK